MMRRRTKLLVFVAIGLLLALAPPAFAQEPSPQIEWRELKTKYFTIIYADSVAGRTIFNCACGPGQAQTYAAFMDDVYQNLVDIFGVQLNPPINLRLFPTAESYYQVNPLARQLPGVMAHALNNRPEIAVALPNTQPLAHAAVVNAMRHELAHIFASQLSAGRLPIGFQEGLAQYFEQPDPAAGRDFTALQSALAQKQLLNWDDLAQAEQVWLNPQVAYPESLAVVAFLVDRYGFPRFIEFIKATAVQPDYRAALVAVYGRPAAALEAEWPAYLPAYFEGRWRVNALYSADLSRAAQRVDNGDFSAAETELAGLISLLQTTHQADKLAEAQHLLARARQVQAAGLLADSARQALVAGNYAQTVSQAGAAGSAYATLGYSSRLPELQIYMRRAQTGQAALNQLDAGAQLLKSWQLLAAGPTLRTATGALQALDNQVAANRGLELLRQLAARQRWLALAVAGVGALLLLANAVRRLVARFNANPPELDYP